MEAVSKKVRRAVKNALRGAEFLDTIHGDLWRRRVKTARLDIRDARYCVLGQLYGDYHNGIDECALTSESACDYGFSTEYLEHSYNHANVLSWSDLSDAWRLVLTRSR